MYLSFIHPMPETLLLLYEFYCQLIANDCDYINSESLKLILVTNDLNRDRPLNCMLFEGFICWMNERYGSYAMIPCRSNLRGF